jgi:hypothetical protein
MQTHQSEGGDDLRSRHVCRSKPHASACAGFGLCRFRLAPSQDFRRATKAGRHVVLTAGLRSPLCARWALRPTRLAATRLQLPSGCDAIARSPRWPRGLGKYSSVPPPCHRSVLPSVAPTLASTKTGRTLPFPERTREGRDRRPRSRLSGDARNAPGGARGHGTARHRAICAKTAATLGDRCRAGVACNLKGIGPCRSTPLRRTPKPPHRPARVVAIRCGSRRECS